MKRNFGKNGLTTKYELLGHSVIPIVNDPPPPKSICDTQSFPEFTSDLSQFKMLKNLSKVLCNYQ